MSWSSRCNFFQICKKNYKCQLIQSLQIFWNALDPVVVIFFAKNIYVVKITSSDLIISGLVIFPTKTFFAKKNYNDWIRPQLVIFLSFFEKNYNDWIRGKLPNSRFKWTGLLKMLWQNFVKIFRWFKTSQFPSEIIWPLALDLLEVGIILHKYAVTQCLIQTCKQFVNKK